MAYSIEQATLLSVQLEKFATSYAHHLVGQFANVDFWIAEANHALGVIENYRRRFDRLRDAQVEWVRVHGTVVSSPCGICGGKCEFDPRAPEPPRPIRHRELEEARRRLKDAVYHFLRRCYRAGLVDEAGFRELCARGGTSVDLRDLKR